MYSFYAYNNTKMTKPLLSILVPTINGREIFLQALKDKLYPQIEALENPDEVQIVICKDRKGDHTTGWKRNWLIDNCKGAYVSMVDDDDQVSDDYVQLCLNAAKSGKPCASLIGLYYFEGKYSKPFIHSIKYDHAFEDANNYYRGILHLNVIKKSILTEHNIRYNNISEGEDGRYMEDLIKTGALTDEYVIDKPIYYYYDRRKGAGGI
jgi:hypothetical protein